MLIKGAPLLVIVGAACLIMGIAVAATAAHRPPRRARFRLIGGGLFLLGVCLLGSRYLLLG